MHRQWKKKTPAMELHAPAVAAQLAEQSLPTPQAV